MSRKMLINAQHPEQLRVAVVDGTALDAYEIEVAESGVSRGNIYRGVIASIEPSLNAAFIEYGAERHGFLSGDDLVPDAYHRKPPKDERRPRVEQVLERGKPVLIQVVKDALGRKGAAMTTSLTLAGRYLVLTPFDTTIGVSRKVDDEASRKQLRERLDGLTLPDGCGVIARTNALQQTKATLNRDLNALQRLWKRISTEASSGRGPRLLYSDQDLVVQALRDHLDNTIDELVVDNDDVLKKAERYIKAFLPRTKIKVTRYEERIPLFARYHLESEVDKIYAREVALPSGGAIVIDRTEALTAIDVNSGKSSKGGGHEETVLRANLEAAGEIARHLRLRDIGGLVIVDFIDMRFRKNQRKVEQAMRQAVKPDRARIKLERLSPNGLMEINRQRMKQQLQLQTHRACPTCSGAGIIASRDFVSLSVLRRIEARAAAGGLKAVRIALHPELADSLQNGRRQELAALEQEFGIRIEVISGAGLHRSEEQVEWLRREPGKDDPKPSRPVRPAITASDLVDDDDSEEDAGGERKKRRRRRRRRRRGGEREDGNGESGVQHAGGQDSGAPKAVSQTTSERAAKPSDEGEDQRDDRRHEDDEQDSAKSGRRRRSRSRRSRSRRTEDGPPRDASGEASDNDGSTREVKEREDRRGGRPPRERRDRGGEESRADSGDRSAPRREPRQKDEPGEDRGRRADKVADADGEEKESRSRRRRPPRRRSSQSEEGKGESRSSESSRSAPLERDAPAGGEAAVRLFAPRAQGAGETEATSRRSDTVKADAGEGEDRLRPPRRRPSGRRSTIKLETAKPEGRKARSEADSDAPPSVKASSSNASGEASGDAKPRRRSPSPRRRTRQSADKATDKPSAKPADKAPTKPAGGSADKPKGSGAGEDA